MKSKKFKKKKLKKKFKSNNILRVNKVKMISS